ncbi:hypothetical protein AB4Z43_28965 [Mesorhizobium sp. 2RAF45]|uniref:hypothetical protein n=1 Tax=Mesorhizobium sp. 2RAF45 TaxID=3233001 RepID=UPI003F9A39ED
MTAEEVSVKFKAVWAAVSAVTVIVVGVISQLVTSPPTLWRDAGSQPVFLSYVATLVVAAGFCSTMAGKPVARPTFGLIAVGIIVIVGYFIAAAQFSCPFVDGRMSVGWTYLPQAADYVAKNPQITCSLLIADYTGATDTVWPKGEIITSWIGVLALYIAAISLVATIVVRTMQSLAAK